MRCLIPLIPVDTVLNLATTTSHLYTLLFLTFSKGLWNGALVQSTVMRFWR